MLKRVAVIAAASLALAFPAPAAEPGAIAIDYLYRGDPAGGLKALEALQISQTTAELAYGEGFLILAGTFQDFTQALYRHGFGAPETGPMGPALSVPIPRNPNPEPLDYETFRNILTAFSRGLIDAGDRFALAGDFAGEEPGTKLRIDPLKIRIDVDGDGTAGDNEVLGNVILSALQDGPAAPSPEAAAAELPNTEIAFDRADAYWLSGYTHLIAAQSEFLLAHDFSNFFNAVFHRFFPQAGLPMQGFTSGGQVMLDPESDNAIADAIAAIHTINWQVIDKEKLQGVRNLLRVVTSSSRENWAAILEETDDDRELLPSPKQSAIFPDGKTTQEMVEAWLATLDTVDQILDGDLLLPHWRFTKGFDLGAYFASADRTDFVMLFSGYDALPFLKDGPIATADSFADANRVFGDNLLGYAFWFN